MIITEIMTSVVGSSGSSSSSGVVVTAVLVSVWYCRIITITITKEQ